MAQPKTEAELLAELALASSATSALKSENDQLKAVLERPILGVLLHRILHQILVPLSTVLLSGAGFWLAWSAQQWQQATAAEAAARVTAEDRRASERAEAEERRALLAGVSGFLGAFDDGASTETRLVAVRSLRLMVGDETLRNQLLDGIDERSLTQDPRVLEAVAQTSPTLVSSDVGTSTEAILVSFFSSERAARLGAFGQIQPEAVAHAETLGRLCEVATSAQNIANSAATWNAMQILSRAQTGPLTTSLDSCRTFVCAAPPALPGPRGQALLRSVRAKIDGLGTPIAWDQEGCPARASR